MDWISLLQTLTWPWVISIVVLIAVLIVIIMFYSQLRAFLDTIIKRVASGSSLKIGKDGLILGEDLSHSDKISEKEKNKVVTELAQKQEEGYTYGDWINAAIIAYTEKKYEAALHGFSQALQYAKTKEQTAKALLNQGFVLGELGRSEEAIVALRKAEVIFSELGMTEDKQKARELIEQWEKEKANK